MQSNSEQPTCADEVDGWLRSRRESRPGAKVRIVGCGSRQHEREPLPAETAPLDLSGLDTIVRLDAGDQTCTVEAGVTRAALDQALAEHQLELPCLGSGSLGGLFASDPIGPASIAGQSPRSLLLGLDGALADGTPFRSGAKVVKSVAGFDVHKLFVGSHGRLFVAKRLHLRLKPAPRARRWFASVPLGRAPALAQTHALRSLPIPPDVLALERSRDASFRIVGQMSGRERTVDSVLREHGLTAMASDERQREEHLLSSARIRSNASAATGAGTPPEEIDGGATPSQLELLLATIDQHAPDMPVRWFAGCRFRAASGNAATSDRLLEAWHKLGIVAQVRASEDASRLGRSTPTDAGQLHLTSRLKEALDPDGIFI
ncbi:MAG: FAD-binding oxidoreductase [Planctomycetota bacterium]